MRWFLRVAENYTDAIAIPKKDRKRIDSLFKELIVLRDRINFIADPDVINRAQQLLNAIAEVSQFGPARDEFIKAARVELGIEPYVLVPAWRRKSTK